MWIYGTAWKEERTESLVNAALEAGFRAFDTANQRKHYHEAGVGSALKTWFAHHPREELWLQTKFTYQRGQDERLPYDPSAPVHEQALQSFAVSLEHLGVSYIDSLVLHGPWSRDGIAQQDRDVWRAMESVHADGRVKALGISNVSASQLSELVEVVDVKPTWVQNRCYARRGWDAEVRAVCAANGVRYQGFSLLTANRATWEHDEVARVAQELGCTTAVVVFRLARSLDIVPLTGTSSSARMREDLGAIQPLPADLVKRVVRLEREA